MNPSANPFSLLPYDLMIIGGGINGAAIARDAALRGLSVALLEKEDFASGASSTNSKLVHGGLRYLAQFAFAQVYESLHERDLLLKNAPELVVPRSFVFPVFSGAARPLWMVKFGLTVYDLLDRGRSLPLHQNLSAQEVLEHFPQLRTEGLQGGCLYYDAQMKDARLVIETILDAEAAGAQCWNYVRVTGLRGQEIDYMSDRRVWAGTLKAKVIVNATGAWANQIFAMNQENANLVRPSKGVHLVIPQVHRSEALVLNAPQDGRIFFVIPWGEYSLLGTTDTFYEGDPDEVKVEKEDVAYLVNAYTAYFGQTCPVISFFVGLRPLPAAGLRADPSNVSRQELIYESPSGMLSILGGKFTTHRAMAEKVVDRVCTQLKRTLACSNATRPLRSTLPAQGQVKHAIAVEKALTLADWYLRTSSIGYGSSKGLDSLNEVVEEFSSLLKWDERTREMEVQKYGEQVGIEPGISDHRPSRLQGIGM